MFAAGVVLCLVGEGVRSGFSDGCDARETFTGCCRPQCCYCCCACISQVVRARVILLHHISLEMRPRAKDAPIQTKKKQRKVITNNPGNMDQQQNDLVSDISEKVGP